MRESSYEQDVQLLKDAALNFYPKKLTQTKEKDLWLLDGEPWIPFHDDGDAFRLAIAAELNMTFGLRLDGPLGCGSTKCFNVHKHTYSGWSPSAQAPLELSREEQREENYRRVHALHNKYEYKPEPMDLPARIRRAIVQAAAQAGRNAEEGRKKAAEWDKKYGKKK